MNAFTSISTITSHRNRLVLLGTAVALISLLGGWFDPATSPRLTAFQMGMGQGPTMPPPFLNPISFGTAGLFLAVLLWLATLRNHGQLMLIASTGLCFVALSCYLQIGLSRASWLEEAIIGATDFQQTFSFANTYSIVTGYDIMPDNGVISQQLGLSDRLAATPACLAYGWLWFTASAIVCLVGSIKEMRDSRLSPYPFLIWFLVLSLFLVWQTSDAFAGQFALLKGDQAVVRNDIPQAEAAYRRAIALDEWYRVRPTAYLKIGVLRKSNGDRATPEACFAIGDDLAVRGFYQDGIFWLEQALTTRDPVLSNLVRQEIGTLSLGQAMNIYHGGAQGVAKQLFLRSIEMKPRQVAAYYMVGRADYDLCNYREAMQYYNRAASGKSMFIIKALCWSARGDCFYALGDVTQARDCYLKSSKLLDLTDNRALKALTDSYFQ